MDEEEAVGILEGHLQRSIRSMLVADVPLGAFVSGGIDSSLMAAMMQKESRDQINLFSIGFNHIHTEHEHARRVAAYLGARFYPLTVCPADVMEALDHPFDEPLGDQAALPTLILSKLTRKHVTVALSGEGADEIFAGYNNYPKRLKDAAICEKWASYYAPMHRWMPSKLRQERLFKAMGRPVSRRYTTIPNLYAQERHKKLFSAPLLDAQVDCLEDLAESHYLDCNSSEYLDRMLHIDANLWLPDDLLMKVDRASMAYSLEARVPYLDRRLIEFAARLPAHFKLRGLETKYLLKKVALRGWLPKEIALRPKWGFVIPLKEWLSRDLKPVCDDLLSPQGLFGRNLFRTPWHEKNGTRQFALMSLELWFRKYAPTFRV
jgi:asparagine synthase (glutamine-hydrolysing)